jgi:hypothetical protein
MALRRAVDVFAGAGPGRKSSQFSVLSKNMEP